MTKLANIGPRGVRQRAVLGVVALSGASALLVALVLAPLPLAWVAPYTLLVWLGGLGVFQARAGT